jgi:hypothetical protein
MRVRLEGRMGAPRGVQRTTVPGDFAEVAVWAYYVHVRRRGRRRGVGARLDDREMLLLFDLDPALPHRGWRFFGWGPLRFSLWSTFVIEPDAPACPASAPAPQRVR